MSETQSPASAPPPSPEEAELAAVLESCLADLEAGRSLDVPQLLADHPAIAHRLQTCLAGMQLLARQDASQTPPLANDLLSAPSRLGDYRIVGRIGQGGMGVVYEAVQELLGRHVALKVLPASLANSPTSLERFRREAQAAAQLHHTNIVPVFGIGACDGISFYAMQHIRGQGLDRLLAGLKNAAAGLPPSEAARIGIQAADGLAHAHRQGVVHRDIKPSNLLLDEQGTVWIADFGLAKASGTDELTQTGQVVGTLRYIAPERFRNQEDARGDIYSLGLTLYELLALRPAFEETDQAVLMERIRRHDLRALRPLVPHLPRDLETIVLKACAGEPEQRYQSAAELGDDLKRFLAGQPIQARRQHWPERCWRWSRRNPLLASALLLAGLALTAVAVVASLFAVTKSNDAEQLAGQKREIENTLEQRDRAEEGKRQVRVQSAVMALAQGLTLCEQGEVSHGLLWLANGVAVAPEDDAALQRLLRCNLAGWRSQVHALKGRLSLAPPVRSIAYHADSGTVLVQGNNGVQKWDVASGKAVGTPLEHDRSEAFVQVHPNGRLALTCGLNAVSVWDISSGPLLGKLEHSEPLSGFRAAFSPDGSRIATSQGSGESFKVLLWDTATRKQLGSPLPHLRTVVAMTFTSDNRKVATACEDGYVRLWEPASASYRLVNVPKIGQYAALVAAGPHLAVRWFNRAQVVVTETGKNTGQQLGHLQGMSALALSSDGRFVITGSLDGKAQLWDAVTGLEAGPALQHPGPVLSAAFQPGGSSVVLTGSGHIDKDRGEARLWNAAVGQQLGAVLSHPGPVHTVRFAADGRTLLTAAKPGEVRLWEATLTVAGSQALEAKGKVLSAVFSPDSRTVLAGSEEAVQLWDTTTGKPRGQPLPHKEVQTASFSSDGKLILTGSRDRTARLWNAVTGQPVCSSMSHEGSVFHSGFSPDGRVCVTAEERSGTVRLWHVPAGQLIACLPNHENEPGRAQPVFSQDGKTVLTGRFSSVRSWNTATGQQHGEVIRCQPGLVSMAFSRSGMVVTVSLDGTVQVWDAAAGKLLSGPAAQQRAIGQPVQNAIFSAEQDRFLVDRGAGMFQYWEASSGQPLQPPFSLKDALSPVAWSIDGGLLLTGNPIRLWDASSGKPLTPPLRQPSSMPRGSGRVRQVSFSADGSHYLTAGDDGSARLWAVPLPVQGDAEQVKLWAQVSTGMEVDQHGAFRLLDHAELQQRKHRLKTLTGSSSP